ncbi:hypothetical protein GM415_03110 [Pseudodesulfovibrio cashew]|uniref:Uncharacterized protein n=1 Tax=Pseudodesulfovibrio cashew TaxID=2678688 RepID=A0A6I6JAQ7_9BACT|nr:hypothetical protein [Pseudodesulfovibrio cashew]QGY39151.1 hypothetical protein GM415_03110 [Pseudodesulfovibrio cashew]
MLKRLLKKPEARYCAIIAVLSIILWIAMGQLSAYIIFFGGAGLLMYGLPYAVGLLLLLVGVYSISGDAIRGVLKWSGLTLLGLFLGTGLLSLVAASPYLVDKTLSTSEVYRYRFSIVMETPDGPTTVGHVVTMDKKRFSLSGAPSGTMLMRNSLRAPSSYVVGDGVYVGYANHKTGILAGLFPAVLRRHGLPLHGRDYTGLALEVDKELFPRLFAHGLKHHDEKLLALYESLLAQGKYKIFVELLGGEVEDPQRPGQLCRYLLALEAETARGRRRAETEVRVIRDVLTTGDGKEHVRLHPVAGFLHIPLGKKLGLQMRFLPRDLVSLPGRLAVATGKTGLAPGNRHQVPNELLEKQYFGGLQLQGDDARFPPEEYRAFKAGKGEYTVWFEVLDGSCDYEIPSP